MVTSSLVRDLPDYATCGVFFVLSVTTTNRY